MGQNKKRKRVKEEQDAEATAASAVGMKKIKKENKEEELNSNHEDYDDDDDDTVDMEHDGDDLKQQQQQPSPPPPPPLIQSPERLAAMSLEEVYVEFYQPALTMRLNENPGLKDEVIALYGSVDACLLDRLKSFVNQTRGPTAMMTVIEQQLRDLETRTCLELTYREKHVDTGVAAISARTAEFSQHPILLSRFKEFYPNVSHRYSFRSYDLPPILRDTRALVDDIPETALGEAVVFTWTPFEVCRYLKAVGYEDLRDEVVKRSIDGTALLKLTPHDLLAMGLPSQGDRLKLMKLVNGLRRGQTIKTKNGITTVSMIG